MAESMIAELNLSCFNAQLIVRKTLAYILVLLLLAPLNPQGESRGWRIGDPSLKHL